MFGTKNDISDEIQKFSESQTRTCEAVRDLDETVATKIGELIEKIGKLEAKTETPAMGVEAASKLLSALESVSTLTVSVRKIATSLDGIVSRLDKMRSITDAIPAIAQELNELHTRIARRFCPTTREDWIALVNEKTEKVFQKLQLHGEQPIYSYLVERRAASLVDMDTRKISELPTAQLEALNYLCDNVLTAMELCE